MQNVASAVKTDREIVEQARRDVTAALGAIYEMYGESLFRLAARILGTRSEAEDIVHDLFVGLPEMLKRYEHRDSLLSWLRAVVVRMALGRLRHERRRAEVTARHAEPRKASLATDPWNAIDLERAMHALSPEDRTVFALKQLEGYSHTEIAGLLDITDGAARVRYSRALRRLRSLLEPK